MTTITFDYWVLRHRETGELKPLSNGRSPAPHLYRTEGHAKGAASNTAYFGNSYTNNWVPVKATLTLPTPSLTFPEITG
jgi:hypothetical protein